MVAVWTCMITFSDPASANTCGTMCTTVSQSHGNIEKIAPQKLIIVTRDDEIEPKILSKVIASKSNWSKKPQGEKQIFTEF